MYFLNSRYMLLETKMLGYIFTFFFILFQQSLHKTSLKIYVERSLFFMYYLLNKRQLNAYIHTCVTRTFLTCNVLKESGFIQEMNYSIKIMHLSAVNLHDWRPSSISAPKISHVTENGQWLRVNKKGNHSAHIGSFESK